MLTTITGIFGERWASANEKRIEFLGALLNEYSSNEVILSDSRFNPNSHKAGRSIVFPRLIIYVTETAMSTTGYAYASGVLAERQDRELFSLLHQWRHTANEFNRRLDITELRTFTNLSPQEICSLYEAQQESKEFNDALNLTKHIVGVLESKYSKAVSDDDTLATSRNRHLRKRFRNLKFTRRPNPPTPLPFKGRGN
jgi:hypothetical protein